MDTEFDESFRTESYLGSTIERDVNTCWLMDIFSYCKKLILNVLINNRESNVILYDGNRDMYIIK